MSNLLENEIGRLHALLADCDSELEYFGADTNNIVRIAISQATGVTKPKKTTAALTLCHCGKAPATDPHPCPYEVEINDSIDEKYCTCCDEYEQNCNDDI